MVETIGELGPSHSACERDDFHLNRAISLTGCRPRGSDILSA
jgi:hypothetical protein